MRKALLIFSGIIIGWIITIIVLYILAPTNGPDKNNDNRYNIQYIEVTGKNGPATLHNYMTKDSVKILLGKPDKTDMQSFGTNLVHENWRYEINDDYTLSLDFENGMLTNVNQY